MNYTKQKQAMNNLEWEKAMKDMGVSQTITDEEISARKQQKLINKQKMEFGEY